MVAALALRKSASKPIPFPPREPLPFPQPKPLPAAAVEQLLAAAYLAYAGPLRRFVSQRFVLYGLPDDRWSAAEDLVQDVFIVALRELRRAPRDRHP